LRFVAVLVFVGLVFSLPTNFDARTEWSQCQFNILNQESCGSCWDFCSVESFSDRMCITGEAPSGTIISPEPILECSRQGCDGGYPSTAWNYLISSGSTTCSKQCFSGCAPYDSGKGSSPKCHYETCDSGSAWPITYNGGAYMSLSTVRNHNLTYYQNELYNNGPLQACFTVYNNFYTFFDLHPKGIYTSASGGAVGGHCVKLIGWGVTSGQSYWLFANSWDTNWGDGGYFRMARGTNLCGIEGSVSEGFTPLQAEKNGMARGVHPNVLNNQAIVGGWSFQSNLEEEHLIRAARAGLHALGQKLHREFVFDSIVTAATQVVAGLNFNLQVATVDGPRIIMRLHRDLQFAHSLVDYTINV
jgi:cathepsin B